MERKPLLDPPEGSWHWEKNVHNSISPTSRERAFVRKTVRSPWAERRDTVIAFRNVGWSREKRGPFGLGFSRKRGKKR